MTERIKAILDAAWLRDFFFESPEDSTRFNRLCTQLALTVLAGMFGMVLVAEVVL